MSAQVAGSPSFDVMEDANRRAKLSCNVTCWQVLSPRDRWISLDYTAIDHSCSPQDLSEALHG